jgi:hypothetical protein
MTIITPGALSRREFTQQQAIKCDPGSREFQSNPIARVAARALKNHNPQSITFVPFYLCQNMVAQRDCCNHLVFV